MIAASEYYPMHPVPCECRSDVITIDHTILAHSRAMISDWEKVEDIEAKED